MRANAIFISFAVTLIALACLFRFFILEPKDKEQFHILNFTSARKELISRKVALGEQIANNLYGKSAGYVLRSNLPLSPAVSAEFTMPLVEVGGQTFGVLEDPLLRMSLWQHRPPDVVLLGSSMLFMNFLRQEFFEEYPHRSLIDFTMGDNNPEISEFLINQALERGLTITPGTIFIYGLNNSELLLKYNTAPNYYSHVYKAYVSDDSRRQKFYDAVDTLFRFPDIRLWLMTTQASISRVLGLSRPYHASLPNDVAHDGAAIQRYLLGKNVKSSDLAKVESAEPQINVKRLEALERLATLIKSQGAYLCIVRVPTSTIDMNENQDATASTNAAVRMLEQRGLEFVDARDHVAIGIDDSDYVFPRNRFDPQHLNSRGARKFTRYLIQNILASRTAPASKKEESDAL